MDKIWEFFETLNEFVYVSDVETHELIYMNKKTLDTYGIKSLEDIKGKKCYEVLQNGSVPCAICNNSELKEGVFREWEYYNPIIGKHAKLKDTVIMKDGRKYRMEIAIALGEKEYNESMIENYQTLESLANEGLRIALKAENPNKALDIILEYLGKAIKGERTYIFERNASGNDDNTYEWVANGVTSEKDTLQNVPSEVCANWYRNFSENKNIIIKDLENIKEKDPLQYENLKRQNIHTLVVVPLYNDEKIIGFYGVDNPPVDFLEYTSNMLQILGHFIVSTLRRRNLLNQLQVMSHHDQLTGFGNRYLLAEYTKNINPEESIGVLYCDVTGLKRVNDSEGHEAGDRLLIRACESLKEAFSDYMLFRIGGDEFLVLCSAISKAELNNRTEILKKSMAEKKVVMAVGAVWREDTKISLDELLLISERLMYKDKNEYYRKTGIERRNM